MSEEPDSEEPEDIDEADFAEFVENDGEQPEDPPRKLTRREKNPHFTAVPERPEHMKRGVGIDEETPFETELRRAYERDRKRAQRERGFKPRSQVNKTTATYEDGDEPWRCRAHSRNANRRCGNPKAQGKQVCRMHGANGGRPPSTGRYSTKLGRFREAYQNSLQDHDGLMNLNETLAMLETYVGYCAELLSQKDTPEFRLRAVELYESAGSSASPEAQAEALNELGRWLRRGASESASFERLAAATEKMATRQEKAWGIKLHASQVLNERDLILAFTRFADIVIQEAPAKHATRILERIDSEVLGAGEGVAGRQDPGTGSESPVG